MEAELATALHASLFFAAPMSRRELHMETATEKNVERLLNRVSLVFASIATLALLHLFSRSPIYCSPLPRIDRRYALRDGGQHQRKSNADLDYSFPSSSCDAASREVVVPDKRFAKLRSSSAWRRRAEAFSALFDIFRSAGILSNASHVLCVSSGAGHEVSALLESGVADVTGVDVVDFPPFVRRADPHNLPFFDDVFDLGFSTGLAGALFPTRFVSEMERTVHPGGVIVLAVDRPSAQDVEEIKALFKRSSLLEVRKATMPGSEMTLIIMKTKATNKTC